MAETHGITGALDRYNLDALVMPTFAAFHLPAIAGLPVVTVPLGNMPESTPVILNAKRSLIASAPGVPFGVSFVGRRWSEETLLGLAYAFEQRTNVRRLRKPTILPETQLSMAASSSVRAAVFTDQKETPKCAGTSWRTFYTTSIRQLRAILATQARMTFLSLRVS